MELIELGINHEQQHQELLLTDILSLFANEPLKPAYVEADPGVRTIAASKLEFLSFAGGIFEVGHQGKGFAYDNESPRHQQLVRPFKLANRLVSNAEWIEFIADGGYEAPTLWLADGWNIVKTQGWQGPLYWEEADGGYMQMSLRGFRPVDPAAPVCHVSFYEADAFARWAGLRLPSEFEWEVAARDLPATGRTLGAGHLRPMPAESGPGLKQMLATSGSGREAPICPIRASRQHPEPWANITASSCAISSCSKAAPAPRLTAMCARPTAISSIHINAGSSWDCGSPVRHDGRRARP